MIDQCDFFLKDALQALQTGQMRLADIRENRDRIKPFGVKKLSLFGSVARGDENKSSDLDFVVEFDRKSFDAYMGLKACLEEIFQCKVDLVLPNTIKPRLRAQILEELVDAAWL